MSSESLQFRRFGRWLLASPPGEWAVSKVRDLLIGALRQGPIPRHVAFVMDGNRRFARHNRIETIEGHNLGFEALARILEVCYKAGVEVVTVYAFSIENFKRSKYEVDALMDMAKMKVSQMAQHGDLLDRYGACIRFLGNPDLLKPDVRRVIDEAVELTKRNKRAVFNVCCPYTSRDEITTAVRDTVSEYTRPIPPSPSISKRPFSETSITRNIRSRRLSNLSQSADTSNRPTQESNDTASDASHTASTANSFSDADRSPSPSRFSSTTTLNGNGTVDYSPPTTHPHSPYGETEQEPELEPSSENSVPTIQLDNTAAESPISPHTIPSKPFHSPTLNPTLASTTKPASTRSSKPSQQKQTYPDPETITSQTLTSHMFTADLPPLDLLVRTSGVERLSDFMLWQCHENTSIIFLNVLWPRFDLWHFLPVLWEWQWWERRGRARESEDESGEAVAEQKVKFS